MSHPEHIKHSLDVAENAINIVRLRTNPNGFVPAAVAEQFGKYSNADLIKFALKSLAGLLDEFNEPVSA